MKKEQQLGYELISTYRSEIMGFAIVMIMFCHLDTALSHNGIEHSRLAAVLHTFTVGVDIFMFLSGFGLYYSYTKKHPTYLTFVKSRLSRVLPLYFVIAGVTYLIVDVMIKGAPFWSFLSDLFFLSFFIRKSTCYWFILGICTFYLLFPVFYRFLHNGHYGSVKLLVFSIVWWFAIGMGSKYSTWVEFFKMPLDRLPIFLFGSYCGQLAMKKRVLKPWEIAFFVLTGYILFALQKRTALNNYSYILYYPIRAFLALSIITTIIAALEYCRKLSLSLSSFVSAGLKWLGGLTLECYLFHQSYLLLFDFPYQFPKYVLTAFALPLISAALVYWLRAVLRKKGIT